MPLAFSPDMPEYLQLFPNTDAAIDNEQAILSIGREHLPDHARRVLDGHKPTRAYWRWLIAQTTEEG